MSLANALRSSPGLTERDITWLVLGPKQITANINNVADRATLEKLHSVDGFQAVLIGKDGSLKASQLGGLDIHGLPGAIDQMPMRQQEMQHQP